MKKIIILLGLLVAAACLKAQDFELIFTKNIGGTDQLFSINQAGKTKQITTHRSKDSSPILAPDGKYIVFTSERVGWWKIWLMDLERNSFTQLTHSSSAEYSPSWSPEGSQIVFISSRSGSAQVFTMNKKGENLKQLTNTNANATTPFWTNDNQIYYSTVIDGTYQIMKMDPDGSNKKQISIGKGDKLMPQPSPDGKSILYYGNQDGNMEIYTCASNGANAKRLTNHSLQDIRPRWSADGSLIVFERGDKRKNQHIYVMNADGTKQRKITSKDYNYAPSFVPVDTFLK